MMKYRVFRNKSFIRERLVLVLPFLIGQFLIFHAVPLFSQAENSEVIWIITDLLADKDNVLVVGNPEVIDSPFGKAVYFDGKEDGIFLTEMPLKNLSEFSIEMLIRFDAGGNQEQRYFHTGSMMQDRVLMEMRSNENTWYLDGMVETRGKWVVLMSPELLHPFGQWYHIAFTVKNGRQTTFVNGCKELEGEIEFSPILEGATSIGVRQNKISWFKGAIYSIRITDRVLDPNEFMLSEEQYFNAD